jgi:hypothetical protein
VIYKYVRLQLSPFTYIKAIHNLFPWKCNRIADAGFGISNVEPSGLANEMIVIC